MKRSKIQTSQLIEFAGLEQELGFFSSYREASRACSQIKQSGLAAREFSTAAIASRAEAECLRRIGRVAEASAAFEEAGEIFLSIGDYVEFGLTLWFRSNLKRQIGDLIGCEMDLREALTIARISKDWRLFVYASAGIAEIARFQGDYHRSRIQHESTGRLFWRRGDLRGVVWALQGLGQIHKNQHRLRISHRLFSQSCNFARKIDDRRALGWGLRGIGEVLREAGQSRESESFLRRSLDSFKASSCFVGAGFALRSLGELAICEYNKEEDALTYLRQARDLFLRTSDSRGEAFVAQSLGVLYSHIGDRDRGIESSRFALRWFHRQGVRFGLQESARHLLSLGVQPKQELIEQQANKQAE